MVLLTSDDARELRTSDTAQEMWELAEEGDPAEARRAYPSGWLWLSRADPVRTLLDALLKADPEARYGLDDLSSMANLSDAKIEDAIDALLSLGVLVADDGTYRANDRAIVYHAAAELSEEVAATGAPDGESGLTYLARFEAVRLMIDALLEVEPERSLTQEDLHLLTGVSRKRVWVHVEKLVSLSVIEESGDEYALDPQSPVLQCVQALDAAVVGASLAPSYP